MSPVRGNGLGLQINQVDNRQVTERSINTMVHIRTRRSPGQQPLLAACTTSRPAPAAHLGRRRDRDRRIGFDDVAALPDPEWSRTDRTASRYSVAGLVPAGQLAAVPLPVKPEPLAEDQAPVEWELALLPPRVEPTPQPEETVEYDAIEAELNAGIEEWLAAEDATFERALADPQPIEALIERARYEMQCRDIAFVDDLAEDRRLSDARCTLIAAAAWVDDAAGLALAEDVQDVLDAFAAHPELAHDTALLMALAPVVAMLKGSVA